ncbi:hypothetical protein HOK51_05950 [Candidatus Woesearchaeota archaeon]|jgi:hypothetical protein|nr:hypothetical protein [Candidatus Woesearchaeota archaeon]MBT6519371.1 hypothetical protein [Candidatus Woesearchaeota archaeon]MBT7367785.1 hypothetical protein [Candidatus Woesearchaeota archaeon]
MAYSTQKQNSKKLADDLEIISGPFSLKQIMLCTKLVLTSIIPEVTVNIVNSVKNKLSSKMKKSTDNVDNNKLNYSSMHPEPLVTDIIGVTCFEHPTIEKLEEICENIGKEVDKKNKKYSIDFAGLMYHLYCAIDKSIPYKKSTLAMDCNRTVVRINEEDYEENVVDRYSIGENYFFSPIKLYVPFDKSKTNLPVQSQERIKILEDTNITGAIELIDYSKKPVEQLRMYIIESGKKLNRMLLNNENSKKEKKDLLMGDECPTYIVFAHTPKLEHMKNELVQMYNKYARIINVEDCG